MTRLVPVYRFRGFASVLVIARCVWATMGAAWQSGCGRTGATGFGGQLGREARRGSDSRECSAVRSLARLLSPLAAWSPPLPWLPRTVSGRLASARSLHSAPLALRCVPLPVPARRVARSGRLRATGRRDGRVERECQTSSSAQEFRQESGEKLTKGTASWHRSDASLTAGARSAAPAPAHLFARSPVGGTRSEGVGGMLAALRWASLFRACASPAHAIRWPQAR